MSEMISFGAGVNSVAMTIMLVNDGWRGPIVFADTGGEWPETYCYMRMFEEEWLNPRGLEITRLSPELTPECYAERERGYGTLEAMCYEMALIPTMSVRWCSIEWKRNPIQRWLHGKNIERQFLGISASEPRRIRYDDPTKQYPLWEEGVTRGECHRIIANAGLEQPTKSGCFFCPGQRLDDWRRLYYEHRDLYERAALLESNASEHRRNKSVATLDSHGISLRQHAARRWQGQMQMDLSQWLPCLCNL